MISISQLTAVDPFYWFLSLDYLYIDQKKVLIGVTHGQNNVRNIYVKNLIQLQGQSEQNRRNSIRYKDNELICIWKNWVKRI